jgi:hypothetical protein
MKKLIRYTALFALVLLYASCVITESAVKKVLRYSDFVKENTTTLFFSESSNIPIQWAKTESFDSITAVTSSNLKNNLKNPFSANFCRAIEVSLLISCLTYLIVSRYFSIRLQPYNIIFPFHYFW